jgi:hypothetical protein
VNPDQPQLAPQEVAPTPKRRSWPKLSASIRASLIHRRSSRLRILRLEASTLRIPPRRTVWRRPPPPSAGDEFLTTEEAAKRLMRSAKRLEYWRTAGLEPPYYRQQRGIRYPLSGSRLGEPSLALIPRTPETEALRLMRDNDSRGFLPPAQGAQAALRKPVPRGSRPRGRVLRTPCEPQGERGVRATGREPSSRVPGLLAALKRTSLQRVVREWTTH